MIGRPFVEKIFRNVKFSRADAESKSVRERKREKGVISIPWTIRRNGDDRANRARKLWEHLGLGQRIPIHRVYTRGCISIGGRCFSCLQAPPATLHPFLTWSTVTLSRRAKDYVYSAEVPPPSFLPSRVLYLYLLLQHPPFPSSFALPFYFVPSFSYYIYTRIYTHV